MPSAPTAFPSDAIARAARAELAPDLARMRRERRARLQAEMAHAGLDALLLLGRANAVYAAGVAVDGADASFGHHFPAIAVVPAASLPHLFTATPHGAAPATPPPPDLPPDHVHRAIAPESEGAARALVDRIREVLGGTTVARLGVDQLTMPLHALLPGSGLAREIADATPATVAARVIKTADEVACLRRAQATNDRAMEDVLPLARPGASQSALSARFLSRVVELGADASLVDPIWDVVPRFSRERAPTAFGRLFFPRPSAARRLAEGDVVWVDTGIACDGYVSDFGRTWVVGRAPSARERDQWRRWCAVRDAVIAATRPGATAAGLTRAARAADGGGTPWLEHLYLAHGIGLDSAEMPLVGSDLGESFDEAVVLAEGMTIVLEPVIWDDGHAGHRAEEMLVVTRDGCEQLTHHGYAPFE
ncbi:MAG TPA: M24 family metallopeptidase [Candidatus Binatia bacterium]|nr:M24 family metallopeptidase [Candidatus Binatia bacterium]